jgi:hypothetical protein
MFVRQDSTFYNVAGAFESQGAPNRPFTETGRMRPEVEAGLEPTWNRRLPRRQPPLAVSRRLEP